MVYSNMSMVRVALQCEMADVTHTSELLWLSVKTFLLE